MSNDEKPLYLLASEVLKHLNNHNYGLAHQIMMELWLRLVYEHHKETEQETE